MVSKIKSSPCLQSGASFNTRKRLGKKFGTKGTYKGSGGGSATVAPPTPNNSTDIATKDIQWQRSALAGRDYKRVTVKVKDLDEAWDELRVEGGGKDGIGDRYENARKFMGENSQINMSEITVKPNGKIIFNDGRHRFAALRDSGREEIDVLMRNSKKWKS